MGLYEELEKGLLEAIEMENGDITLEEKPNMPAPTYIAAEKEKKLIEQIVQIRKEQNVSQSKLAEMTGNKQQAISRLEKNEHSPSLKLFCNMVNALGYDIKLIKAQKFASN